MAGPLRRLRAFRDRWRATHDAVRSLEPSVADALDRTGSALERADHATSVAEAARDAVDRLTMANHALRQAISGLEAMHGRSELRARVAPATYWLERAEVPEDTTVSIVLATKDRSEHLRRAIRSVVAQRYPAWELLVVDDGEGSAAEQVVRSLDDERVRYLHNRGHGVSAARNTGLHHARGSLVAYLDDDNLMDPLWIKGVVWAFGRRPDAEVIYGARIVEDPRSTVRPPTPFPTMHLEPFHRRRLEEGNFIDLGSLAHRAGLPEATFDEELEAFVDWDLVLRLTRHRPAIAVPIVACAYTSSATNRIQHHPGRPAARDAIVSRVRAERPLRVLAYNAMFPLISETYVEEELEALCRVNADLVYARRNLPPVEMPVDRPVYNSLDAALAEYEPDLIVMHWLTWADEQLPAIEATGLPFAVRIHSFDFDPEMAERVGRHPSCIGLWGYAHHAALLPNAHVLPAIFTSASRLPPPAATRDLVLSTSAGLPKKDWPVLVEGLARVEGADKQIVVATTLHMEDVPHEVAAMAGRRADGPEVHIDVPRHEVFQKLSRAAALVYTLDPSATFGNPMSVVEGLCAGASVILPDRPEARRFAGPGARFYTSADDIAQHAKEILAGGPAIEDEQSTNRAYGMRAFADPALGRRFYGEVVESLDAWRRERLHR